MPTISKQSIDLIASVSDFAVLSAQFGEKLPKFCETAENMTCLLVPFLGGVLAIMSEFVRGNEMKKSILFGAAVIAMATGALPASAALIDFTDNTTGFSGSIGLISWTLTGSSAPNTNEGGPSSSIGVLLGDNDGVGIGDDEITYGGEYLTLNFSEQVTLTAAYYLDLFIAPEIQDFEVANITIGSAPGAADASANADDVFQNGWGYRELTNLGLFGSSFTFWAGGGNDNRGSADFALAAVDISPVPLPAGLVLLGTALAGFGALRRKRQNVA